MPEAFFTAGEDGLLVTAFEVDDAVGVQPGLGELRNRSSPPTSSCMPRDVLLILNR
jgi:hypothetical protein